MTKPQRATVAILLIAVVVMLIFPPFITYEPRSFRYQLIFTLDDDGYVDLRILGAQLVIAGILAGVVYWLARIGRRERAGSLQVAKVLPSSDGNRRVVLFRRQDGYFGLRRQQRIKNVWQDFGAEETVYETLEIAEQEARSRFDH